MEIQLKDIVEETGYKINLLITYIDQTDFMDEVCDYSNKRIDYGNPKYRKISFYNDFN